MAAEDPNKPTGPIDPNEPPTHMGGDAETSPLSPTSRGTRSSSGFSTPYAAQERMPERIGPYRLQRELGRGGMGVVYLAQRDEGMRQRVAIKVVKKGMDSEDVLRRFDLERRVLAALNHPNIARLIDGGATEDGRPYFVVEYVEGLPIDKFCDTRRLKITERLEMFQKVCAAVHYAHQNLIVHRDLKPGNILVSNDGQPKLLDFGIAKMLNPEMTPIDHTPTAAELRLMTPEYASPEQVRGEPLSTASDVYSLGVLLYELLTGHRPYRLRTRAQQEIVRVICEVEPEKPSTAVSKIEEIAESTPSSTGTGAPTTTTRTVGPAEVSKTREGRPERLRRRLEGDLDNIVLMAMRKEPQRRYVSAEQLAEDIRRHLTGLTVMAHADSFWYRGAKFVTRNKFWVAAAAALFISLTGGIAATTWQYLRAETQRKEAVAQRQKADDMVGEVVALGGTLVTDMFDSVKKLPGNIDAMKVATETGTKYLEGLEAKGRDDPRIRQFLMVGYDRLGDMRGGIRGSNLGDHKGAMEAFEKALALAEALPRDTPELADKAARSEIAARIGIGDCLAQIGEREKALAAYEKAFESSERLMKEKPDDAAHKRNYATALMKVGDMHKEVGALDKAFPMWERSVEVRRTLYDAKQTGEQERRDLSTGLIRVATERLEAGDAKAARALIGETLALRKALLDAAPENAREKRDFMRARRLEGLIQSAEGDKAAAAATLRECLATARWLAKENPKDAREKINIMEMLLPLSDIAAESGDAPAAVEAADEVIAAADEAATAHPTDLRFEMYRADGRLVLGHARMAGQQPGEAIEAYTKARSIAQALHDKDPQNAKFKERLTFIDDSMAKALESIKRSAAQK